MLAGAYVTSAALRNGYRQGGLSDAAVEGTRTVADVAMVDDRSGSVLFQNLIAGDHWLQVGAVEVGGGEWPRMMLPLKCERIHYAADRGLCLGETALGRYAAFVFGPDFRVRHKLALSGLPSRARVSPDGRLGATTVFVSGHSYAEAGFSTETVLFDLATGHRLAQLEEFTVYRDGQELRSVDFNYWGVTFKPDSNEFYATLSTRGETYLVEGRVDLKEARVLRENVECPSLSPDGTRIAFKKRVGRFISVAWRFHVLDLATNSEIELAEARSIDDQIEWLDNDQVLYGDGADTWVIPSDGSGRPQRFISRAVSPAVARASKPALSSGTGSAGEEGLSTRLMSLPPADLHVQVIRTSSVRVGAEISHDLTITNHGPSDASSVLLTYELPKGVAYRSAATTGLEDGSWGCALQSDPDRITCDAATVPSGRSWIIELTFAGTASGVHKSRVHTYATEPDPNPHNNEAYVSLDVQ
jgi:uncharacterized repeat protein (TIGR01451 family)